MQHSTIERQAGRAERSRHDEPPPYLREATPIQILSVVCVITGRDPKLIESLSELLQELATLPMPTELVAMLNGCDAQCVRELRALTESREGLQFYVLKGRVDYPTAILAGIENAVGDWVATFDVEADDPAIVRQLINRMLLDRSELVLGYGLSRSRPWLESTVSRLYHRVFSALHGFNLAVESPTARLLSRQVVNRLLKHDRPLIAMETLAAVEGYHRSIVNATRRFATHRPLSERVAVRWRALIGLSSLPLRLANLLCGASAGLAVAYSLYVVIVYAVKQDVIPGWTTVSLVISAMFLTLSLVLWLLSEYMIMLLDPGAHRPRYEIEEEFGGRLAARKEPLNVETEL